MSVNLALKIKKKCSTKLNTELGIGEVMEFTIKANDSHLERSEISERALIGCALVSGVETFGKIAGIVTSEDFGNGELRLVFAVLESMCGRGEPIEDTRLVVATFKCSDAYGFIGGHSGIAKLANEALPHHAVYYATQIRYYSRIRKAWNASACILNECVQDEPDLTAIAEIAVKLTGVTSAMELMNRMGE